MKFLCPECERLISLEQFRLDGGVLVVTCQECSVETRVEAAKPITQPLTQPITQPAAPRVTLASTAGGSNVVVLRTAGHEAVQKAAAAAETPFTIPEGVCPKCIARRASSAECPHCGIRFETFDEATVLPPKWLREAWVDVLRAWDDEARHSAFRRKAQQADALAGVARLYRLRQAAVPEDPVAAEGLAEIVRLASVPIGLPRPDELSDRRAKVVTASVFVVGLVLVGLLLLAVFK